jgi:hypothetical protein
MKKKEGKKYIKNDESLYGVNDLSVFSTDQGVRT